jgi:hypothetical protein
MKYLKRFNESIEDIDSICRKYGITNYTVHPDGTVDVDGDVDLYEKKLTRLPIKFGKVSGSFWCSSNELTTLEGCPSSVGGHFYCDNNQLTTLKGGPKEVGGSFFCSRNKLTTLEGCPTSVGDGFYFHKNQLTIINWDDVYTLNATYFNLEDNPIFEVYNIFPDFKTFKDSLEWNYFKEPNIIIRNKFVEACEILEEETESIVIPEKIKGYIFE